MRAVNLGAVQSCETPFDPTIRSNLTSAKH
jgi:hypothetical protein